MQIAGMRLPVDVEHRVRPVHTLVRHGATSASEWNQIVCFQFFSLSRRAVGDLNDHNWTTRWNIQWLDVLVQKNAWLNPTTNQLALLDADQRIYQPISDQLALQWVTF